MVLVPVEVMTTFGVTVMETIWLGGGIGPCGATMSIRPQNEWMVHHVIQRTHEVGRDLHGNGAAADILRGGIRKAGATEILLVVMTTGCPNAPGVVLIVSVLVVPANKGKEGLVAGLPSTL